MSAPHSLFTRYGVELEYMLVRRDTLSVLPAVDQILHAVAGAYEAEVERGALSWSNELVLHVIELKTNGPAETLEGLAEAFQRDVRGINGIAAGMGGRLMPTAMHPWMEPNHETLLWPHEYSPVYEAFNRIFDCRGHGWCNLQSTHLNLPFAGDEEFGRLHAAIRLVLPILPALAASSPVVERQRSGWADTRLEVYRGNARRVPSVGGRVIPEPVFTRQAYEQEILERMYRDIAPYDTDGILQHEWLNARGAIARFDRGAIEIRVLDIQECPAADLAILDLVVRVLRGLVEERWCPIEQQRSWLIEPLEAILLDTVRDAGNAVIRNAEFLGTFGQDASAVPASELWRHLRAAVGAPGAADPAIRGDDPLDVILEEGCLAHRIQRALAQRPMESVYRDLCDCLAEGRMFHAES